MCDKFANSMYVSAGKIATLKKDSSNLNHVLLRHPFRDAYDERNLRLDGIDDGIRGEGRRHVDHAGVGL